MDNGDLFGYFMMTVWIVIMVALTIAWYNAMNLIRNGRTIEQRAAGRRALRKTIFQLAATLTVFGTAGLLEFTDVLQLFSQPEIAGFIIACLAAIAAFQLLKLANHSQPPRP